MSKDIFARTGAGAAKVHKIQRYSEKTPSGVHETHPDAKRTDDVEFLFGSISPRYGTTKMLSELESPEHTQRDTNESDNNISSCSTLDIINKVENLSLQQLETQVRELAQRLKQTEEQRTDLQRQLEESCAEKELCFRRLEVVSAAHECRITEMHCVIAELSKKLRAKQESTIVEEQEPEGSEISFQEGSVYNSELNLTNPDAECQTDPLDEAHYSAGYDNGDDHLCSETNDDIKMNETANKAQVEALQEEVFHLKAEIALLQSEIANSLRLDQQAAQNSPSVEFYGDIVEANESNCSSDRNFHAPKREKELKELNTTAANFITPLRQCKPTLQSQHESLIPKMAERVKLRCASKSAYDNVSPESNLLSDDIKDSNLVAQNNLNDSFVAPFEDNELQRLQRKVEHLKIHNTVLSLTLDECKEHCEHLYLLCGKYESNAIALQSAVNCSDRAIEAYDVMLALLESKLALLKEKSCAAEDSRKAVESVARHLLDRLESEKNTCENSLGPWQNTFSIPDKVCAPWTQEDDNRLRYHVSKLKGRRTTVQNTIVNLESPFSDYYEKSRKALESGKESKDREKPVQSDLEMAVLMQEMMNLREENIGLKLKVKDAETERLYAMDRVGVLQEALKQLQMQLTADSNVLFNSDCIARNRVSYSEAEHLALTEQQLIEALTRESELKVRIQSLISSVSACQKVSDEKYEQLHGNVKDLQKSNQSLSQLLEQNKRKYQARIRKLEQKIMEKSLNMEHHRTDDATIQVQQAPHVKCKIAVTKPLTHDNVPETTL